MNTTRILALHMDAVGFGRFAKVECIMESRVTAMSFAGSVRIIHIMVLMDLKSTQT
jgi:hypothetical protein